MKTKIAGLLLCGLALGSQPVLAETVQIESNGLKLNAELLKSESFGEGPVVLLTHGTLAHKDMEIITVMRDTLLENGISSLSPSLSFGLSDRKGMYDCPTPHTHRHEDAATEIGLWVDYLKQQGAKDIVLMGHSRGGGQTAQYAANNEDPMISHVVLVAPMTFDAAAEAQSYESRYNTPLAPLMAKAKALVEAGKGDELIENIGFIYCENTSASAAALLSYYGDDTSKDTPTVIPSIKKPLLTVLGSEDTVVAGLPEALESLKSQANLSVISIDGADHFFLDLYALEAIEAVVEAIGN